MASSWAVKKQISYFLIVVIIIFGTGYFVWRNITKPTCFDIKKNQGEEGIDCGGPCEEKCLGEVKDLIILWSKFFEISKGKYDLATLIKNPNAFLALPSVKYQFKIYDKSNILIAVKEGETFITPSETFPIFETNVDTSNRIPSRVFIEFEKSLNWERVEKGKLPLIVSKKQFFNEPPFPRLVVGLENKSIVPLDDIFVAAVLSDKDKNAQGVSLTKIDSLSGEAYQEIVFTWPQPFSEEPAIIEVLFRSGLENGN